MKILVDLSLEMNRKLGAKQSNVVFLLQHLGYLKHFEKTIQELTEHGAFVTIMYYKKKESFTPKLQDRILKLSRVQVIFHDNIISKSGKKLSSKMRQNIDFFHYQKTVFKYCPELAARFNPVLSWKRKFPENYIDFLSRSSETEKFTTLEQKIEVLSALFDSYIEPSRKLVKKLQEIKPTSILISPFLDGEAEPYAFLKYGRSRQIPVTYLMASWDNLQNKGVLLPAPDQYLVWTEDHKRQLIELHNADEKKVHVVGSEILEIWGRTGTKIGDLAITSKVRKIRILYFCSSPFIADGKEVTLLMRIINHLAEKNLNGWQIWLTIKTHPQVEVEKIRTMLGSNEKFNFVTILDLNQTFTDDELTQSHLRAIIHKNDICVGLNSSILLESVMQGLPFIMISNTFEELRFPKTLHSTFLSQYATAVITDLNGLDKYLESAKEFSVRNSEITKQIREDFLITNNKTVSSRVRQTLSNLELAHQQLFSSDDSKVQQLLTKKNSYLNSQGILLMLFKWKTYERILDILRNQGVRALFYHIKLFIQHNKMSKRILLDSKSSLSEIDQIQKILLLPNEIDSDKENADYLNWDTILSDSRIFKIKDSETYIQLINHSVNRIRNIASGYENIVIGPWFSELGFELLYWVPFLNHVMTNEVFQGKNIVTISRGGVEELYGFIPNKHINLLEFYDQTEWTEITSHIWQKLGGLKQSKVVPEEVEILRKIRNRVGICERGRTLVLHPSIMYSLFRPFWRNKSWNADAIESYLDFPEFSPGKTENYCAVKIYSRPSLTMDPKTTSAIKSLLDAEKLPLKIIVSDSYKDDHEVMNVKISSRAQLIHIDDYVSNLYKQFAVIKESCASYTTYGGLSYFGLYFGKICYSLYSDSSKFDQQHLKVARLLADKFSSELVLIQV